MLALGMVALSLGAAAWALEDELAGVLDGLLKGIVASGT
jgi:hypothetical protein